MVGIVKSVERTLQPIGGVGPNPRWLARRLVYANTLGKYASNAVTGIKNTFAGTSVGVGRWGSVRSFNGSTDYVAEPFSRSSAKRTYFIRFQADGTGGGGFGRFWDKDGAAGGDLECNCFFDGSTITFQQAFDGGANGVWTIPHTTTGSAFSLTVVFDGSSSSNDPVMYIDGVSKTVTETTAPLGNRYSNAEGFSIGNRAWDQGRGWNGWLADFLMFDELLTASEAESLHANPYQARDSKSGCRASKAKSMAGSKRANNAASSSRATVIEGTGTSAGRSTPRGQGRVKSVLADGFARAWRSRRSPANSVWASRRVRRRAKTSPWALSASSRLAAPARRRRSMSACWAWASRRASATRRNRSRDPRT